ncbi:cytochrome P450 [Mycobacteroides abscessus]
MPNPITERYNIPPQQFWLHDPRSGPSVEFDATAGIWNLYGYPEVQRALNDPAVFSSDTMRVVPEHLKSMMDDFSMEGFITQIDPPQHGKLRKLVSSAFTRNVVADLEPRIAAITHELLDTAADRGQLELIADLAYPLPVIVIADMLGIPNSDRALFKKWADGLFQRDTAISLAEPSDELGQQWDTAMAPWQEMSAYLAEHAAQRKRRPRADLLTRLVQAEVDGEHLPAAQVVNFAIVLLLAGHITTTMLLGNTVLCLDAFPEQQDNVREDRSLIPAMIEESLRLLTPFAAVARSTVSAIELAGVTISADQMVMAWLATANRDPRQFPNPQTFVPSRDPNPHLAFGRGPHFCLGAPLARLEGKVALNILLDRTHALRTDPNDPVEFMPTPTLTGLRRLPLA